MKAFQLQQFIRPRELKGGGSSGSMIPAFVISIPPLAGVAGLAGAAGLLPGLSPVLWFSFFFILACGAMAGVAFRLEAVVRRLRHREAPSVEMLGTTRNFIERLEDLVRDSKRVCVLDRSGLTPHLAEAPRFLNAQCSPRSTYRQISTVDGKEEFRNLVRLIRRSNQAERGSYFAVHHHPMVAVSTSFCLVERHDGLYTFLVYQLRSGKGAHVVLFRDDDFGRRMRAEFDRIWCDLAESGSPLFHEGALNESEEARLRAAWRGEKPATRQLRAA